MFLFIIDMYYFLFFLSIHMCIVQYICTNVYDSDIEWIVIILFLYVFFVLEDKATYKISCTAVLVYLCVSK